MLAPAVWKWVLLGMVRTPWLASIALSLVFFVPLIQTLRPFPSPRGALDVGCEGATAAGILGTCQALARLSLHEALLVRLAPALRWVAESGSLLLAALYLQFPIYLGALVTGARVSDLLVELPDILTAAGLLAGTAQLLLIPTLNTAHRILLFLAAVWFVPALMTGGTNVVSDLVRSFDAGALLRVRSGSGDIWPHAAAALVLALLGYLLRTRPGQSPQ